MANVTTALLAVMAKVGILISSSSLIPNINNLNFKFVTRKQKKIRVISDTGLPEDVRYSRTSTKNQTKGNGEVYITSYGCFSHFVFTPFFVLFLRVLRNKSRQRIFSSHELAFVA